MVQRPGTDAKRRQVLTTSLVGLNVLLSDPELAWGWASIAPRSDEAAQRKLENISNGLAKLGDERTAPRSRVDREAIASRLRANAKAFVTAQNPRSSDGERDGAERKLDRSAAAVENPHFKAALAEVKGHHASAACVTTIEDRTRLAGWPDGTLWGLKNQACAEPLAAGVEDTSSTWHRLFACVAQRPFSTCPPYIPKD
jgi:hypothetical protein